MVTYRHPRHHHRSSWWQSLEVVVLDINIDSKVPLCNYILSAAHKNSKLEIHLLRREKKNFQRNVNAGAASISFFPPTPFLLPFLYFEVLKKKCRKALSTTHTCPSKRRALPDTRGFPARTQASFNRYLVATLSVASKMISYLVLVKIFLIMLVSAIS